MDVEVIEINKISNRLSVNNEGKFYCWFQESLMIILCNFRKSQTNLHSKLETLRFECP